MIETVNVDLLTSDTVWAPYGGEEGGGEEERREEGEK